MLSFTATGIPSVASRATCRNAFSAGLRSSMARSEASTSSRALACVFASCHGRLRSSLTEHLRKDERAGGAERGSIRRDRRASDRRPRHILAQWRGLGRQTAIESGDVNLAQLIDVRKDLRHLAGHPVQTGVIEFEMRQSSDAFCFLAIDLHRLEVYRARVAQAFLPAP